MIDLAKYRWWRIEPVDAWFFRDGRPSNRGEDQSDMESEFPPNATTVVGALRAALARANGWSGRGSWVKVSAELKRVLGDGFDDLGELSFLGPFLCKRFDDDSQGRREELLWPLPRHVAGRFEDGKFIPEALLQPSAERVCCDVNPDGICLPELPPQHRADEGPGVNPKPPAQPDNVFVTTTGLDRILAGEAPKADECISADKLFARESRVGIQRDADSRTTGGGDMYSPRYVRLHRDVSLVHGIAGVPEGWRQPSIMPLGGQSRMATVEWLESAPSLPAAKTGSTSVAIALSPARFGETWWGAGPGDRAAKLSDGLPGAVISLALDRPHLIGGWDFEANAPRPLAPFAPAGTVWWLDDDAKAKSALTQFGSCTAYGYGLAAVAFPPKAN